MNVYFDNDVIHKLAACDLLREALQDLRVDAAFVLATARFKFYLKSPEKGAKRYGQSVHKRISNFVASARAITEEPNAEDIEVLNAVLGIDQGEAILFATVSRTSEDILLTGDKRSLIALAEHAGSQSICARLAGRVLCLEQVVQRIVSGRGFEHVRERVAPSVACDTVLQIIFREGLATTEAHAAEGLSSYVSDLRAKTGGLLGAEGSNRLVSRDSRRVLEECGRDRSLDRASRRSPVPTRTTG